MGAEWLCVCHVGILHESSIKILKHSVIPYYLVQYSSNLLSVLSVLSVQ